MQQLLKTEWLKLKNYRTFWILGILYLCSLMGVNYIVYKVQTNLFETKQSQGIAQMVVGNPPFEFPKVWQMASYVSSFLHFMPGLIIIILVTNEFSFKTHRQNIIDGQSRTQFILTKQILTLIISFIAAMVVAITAVLFGLQGQEKLTITGFQNIGLFFVQCLGYTNLALLISVLTRRSGIAIGVYFLYVTVLENILVQLLNHYANNTGYFLPLETNDSLIKLPAFEAITNQYTHAPAIPILLACSLVYIGLYVFASKRKLETMDL
jgi:ABC-type transport system involved in multi-copper enzyme maturation permease subunit